MKKYPVLVSHEVNNGATITRTTKSGIATTNLIVDGIASITHEGAPFLSAEATASVAIAQGGGGTRYMFRVTSKELARWPQNGLLLFFASASLNITMRVKITETFIDDTKNGQVKVTFLEKAE